MNAMMVFVKSPDEWKELSEILEADGIKWCDGDKLTEWNPFVDSSSVKEMDNPSFVLKAYDFSQGGCRCYYYASTGSTSALSVEDFLSEYYPEPFNNKISIEDILNDSLVSPAGACKAE